MNFRIKKVKELRFKRPDGVVVDLDIPSDLEQSQLRHMISSDYIVVRVVVGREVRESEVVTLKQSGIAGYLIPGQALLSSDHPFNSDRLFGTYSLVAAMKVCADSFKGHYAMAEGGGASATSISGIFEEGVFYAVVWLKKLKITAEEFSKHYFVSLAKFGLYISDAGGRPLPSSRTLESYDQSIALARNQDWPDYIRVIVAELSPYAVDPFLRFFYIYQVIETLMAVNYTSKLATIKAKFVAQADVSITQLKEYVKAFQGITKEDARIKGAMHPPCASSEIVLKKLLAKLEEDDSEMDFGERIYKIRNIMFHDYQRVLHLGEDVSRVEENLMDYILDKKLA